MLESWQLVIISTFAIMGVYHLVKSVKTYNDSRNTLQTISSGVKD